MGRRGCGSPWLWAALALSLVLGWQALTVRANYAGNWTGLFRVGHAATLPPRLAPATFRNPHPAGYDGQFYRLLAHDPFLRLDTVAYLDLPLLRSRRILVPLAAWVLAGGRDGWIDGAYVLVVAAFVFLGVYALAMTLIVYGRHPAWGMLFVLVPAVPISVDSMTVDVALAALTACFAWRLASGRERGLWWILAAACLVRETGVLLPAACAIAALLRRDLRKACLWATAALPAVAWYAYLYRVLPAATLAAEGFVPRWFYPQAKAGILLRTFDPPTYPRLGVGVQDVARGLDFVALVATLLTVVAGILLLRKMQPVALRAAFLLYLGLLIAATDRDFWNTPYGYARPIAPLFVLVLVGSGSRRWWILPCVALLPALVDLRICAEMQTQAMGVLRALTGG
jgi:hypothetical protein